jgi:undecaprenyl-diphosphatase
MDLLLVAKAAAMGILEGVTEFLPISSTGHLIILASLLHFGGPKATLFEVVIQSGAMLAVMWEFRERFLGLIRPASWPLLVNLVVAFLPAAVLGLLFGSAIKRHLFAPVPVALAFIVGGLIILWAETRTHRTRVDTVDQMTWLDALKIGCCQCLALIPGTSRAGSTIIGGLFVGLSRPAATQFSFFLAVPMLLGASAHELVKGRALLSAGDAGWFAAGLITAFVSALLVIRWLLRYVSSHDFKPFAWYRIAFGLIVLLTGFTGLVEWTAD